MANNVTKAVRKLLSTRGFNSLLKNGSFSRHQIGAVSVIPVRWFNLQEYQSKRLMPRYGINIQRFYSEVAEATNEAVPNEALDQAHSLTDESKSVYLGNLSWDTDESTLDNFFKSFDIYPSNIMILMRDGRSRGFGFAQFDTPEEAQDALKLNSEYVDGRIIKVGLAVGKRVQRGESGTIYDPSNTLFMGNLPYSLSKDQLYEVFGDDVSKIRLITDRETGNCRGYGFIEYDDVPSAEKAKSEYDGVIVAGRNIRVRYAKHRDLPGDGAGLGGGDGEFEAERDWEGR